MARMVKFSVMAAVLGSIVLGGWTGGIMAADQAGPKLEGCKIAMIIAYRDFRDEEFKAPQKVFTDEGAAVTVFSSKTGKAYGMLGATVPVDQAIADLKVDEFDAVVFVGGAGVKDEYWNNAAAQAIAKQAVEKDKVLGAICIAPVVLANAGVLEGKQCTVWSDVSGEVKKKGGQVAGKPVVVDGKIVTGNGPDASKAFALAVVDVLAGAKQP